MMLQRLIERSKTFTIFEIGGILWSGGLITLSTGFLNGMFGIGILKSGGEEKCWASSSTCMRSILKGRKMKVTVIKYCDEDYVDLCTIKVDGVYQFSAGGGEPEDNILGRDLKFVYSIPNLMQLAHTAGKAGENFEIEVIECVNEDEWDEMS
jgi:hypothetical protein